MNKSNFLSSAEQIKEDLGHALCLAKWKQVQSFDALYKLYTTIKGHDPEIIAGLVAEDLVNQLDLPVTMMYDKESKFFKHHYRSNWHNQGVMVREIDVIRNQEGW
jgi:hypothetical protein